MSGTHATLAPFQVNDPALFGNGAVGAPSIAFASDPTTGLYRIGAGNIGIALGGVKAVDLAASTFQFISAVDGLFSVLAATGNFAFTFRIQSGAAGQIPSIQFNQAATNVAIINATATNIRFYVADGVTVDWQMTDTNIFESSGAGTIRTTTGALTLATNGGNGGINISPNGTGVVTFTVAPSAAGAGVYITNTTGTQSLRVAQSANNAGVQSIMVVDYNRGTGNIAANDGVAISLRADSTVTPSNVQAQISMIATTVTDATRASALAFLTQTAGGALTEQVRIASALVTLADAVNVAVGTTTGTQIGTAITQKIGLYGATPIAQRAGAAQAAVATTASTPTTPYGYTTAAQADAIVTLVNELRAWAVAQGAIKGSA